jgi:DNA (cytosine-5)-methyltransferase 1
VDLEFDFLRGGLIVVEELTLFDISAKDYFDSILNFFSIDEKKQYLDEFGEKIHHWAQNNIPQINVVSIFSGAGGLDIGFRDAGFNIISHLELEEDFCKTLEMNSLYFNNANIINTDIRQYSPTQKQKCEFIIGGPPCQTFSAAGRRAAGVQGLDDHKGVLFEEYIRLLKFYNPKGFLFENVYGITGAQGGKAWELIKNEFAKVGYSINYRILNTADYGVPQFRERMIIVGTKNKTFHFPRPIHGPDSISLRPYYSARHAFLDVPINEDITKLNVNGRHGYLLNDIPPGLNYSFYTEKMGHPNPIFAWRSKFSDYLYKADPEKPVRTIKAQAGQYTGPLHWENRYLTINEFKRLQSFPDSYTIFGNKQKVLQQIGNSVPPQFARILAISILNQVFGIQFPFSINYLKDSETLTFRKRKILLTEEYAKKAHKANPHNIKSKYFILEKEQKFKIFITPEFKTIVNQDNGYNVFINTENNNIILNIDKANLYDNIFYEVHILPNIESPWILKYKQVVLRSFSNDIWSYTVAWKAFEYFLKSNKIKDDIVQLNGYYQYTPSLNLKLNIIKNNELNDRRWIILTNILKVKPIRKIYSYDEFSSLVNINATEIDNIALDLKSLGYEIRNHNTNPQIHKEHILLPYLFPTLTNLSVQLRKKL